MNDPTIPRASSNRLAAFAADAGRSRGRLHAEAASASRSPFQRDRDRIIHCGAFRRLALKTQVFLPEESDQYRTRLTHTIEVAQIARTISRALGLDDDLTETLALAHDLGHPPFGHTGEDALNRVVAAAGGSITMPRRSRSSPGSSGAIRTSTGSTSPGRASKGWSSAAGRRWSGRARNPCAVAHRR